ncbi:MAG: FAD-binding protein, partial [Candidatus Scalindua sp.]|nr:FAD-binding protein [Candidatus Scalindua sp.]
MKLFTKNKKEVNKHQKALNELIRVVGKERVLSSVEDRICYSYDGTKQKVLPDIVVRPGDTTDVSNTLKIANQYEVPIYARGAGSGLTGGAVPLKGGIVFDLKNMNRIIEICPEDFVATVEPGVVTKQLQDEVAKFDLFYPPDPSSAAFSTIGGNVAECAGGITGLKYGVTRDYILALEIVLPDGSVINTGGKTGYDLTRLFTGSEGTLGIFTKITVKLIPKPEKIRTLAAHFRNKDDAIDAADRIIDNNILPRTLEFLDQMTINALRGHTGTDMGEDVKALLLIDLDGTEESINYEMPVVENACKECNGFR